MFKNIVVATDGSADAERAFDVACALGSEAGSCLIAVHVTEVVGGKDRVARAVGVPRASCGPTRC